MNIDYFESKKTGGCKDSIEITVDIKADKVLDFVDEIKQAVINEVLEIIDEVKSDANKGYMFDMADEIKYRVLALIGGEQE